MSTGARGATGSGPSGGRASRGGAAAGSATDKAYQETKQAILDGRFPGNSVLSEGQVSTLVGISRTPVREAFLRLQAEGLLTLYPKRGAVVTPITLDEAGPILEARQLIEGFALTKILTSHTGAPPKLLTALHDALIDMAQARSAESAKAFGVAERTFHRRLIEAADNSFLDQVSHHLRERQDRLWATLPTLDARQVETSYREHVAMANAIEDGELDRALSLLRGHLRGWRALLNRGTEA